MLVVAPVDSNMKCLPSPNQLKHKIIIKHKKLTSEEGEPLDMPAPAPSTSEPAEGTDLASIMMDLSNSIKNGYLFMQDPIDKVGVVIWKRGVVFMWVWFFFLPDVGTALLCPDTREDFLYRGTGQGGGAGERGGARGTPVM